MVNVLKTNRADASPVESSKVDAVLLGALGEIPGDVALGGRIWVLQDTRGPVPYRIQTASPRPLSERRGSRIQSTQIIPSMRMMRYYA